MTDLSAFAELVSLDHKQVHLRADPRVAGGTHEDWDEYDRVMAAERRAAVLVSPRRSYTPGG